jgi:hypothetical protein
MNSLKFAIYPPAEPNLPHLAVVLSGDTLVDSFACDDQGEAEDLLAHLRARFAARAEARSLTRERRRLAADA